MTLFRIKKPEQKVVKPDNSVKMGNVNNGEAFKISWRNLKKIHHTCDIEGKDSDPCRRALREAGVSEFFDE